MAGPSLLWLPASGRPVAHEAIKPFTHAQHMPLQNNWSALDFQASRDFLQCIQANACIVGLAQILYRSSLPNPYHTMPFYPVWPLVALHLQCSKSQEEMVHRLFHNANRPAHKYDKQRRNEMETRSRTGSKQDAEKDIVAC
jgi:hypothetical protein